MWEQIRANKRKSLLLIVVMATLLVLLGYAIGFYAVGPDRAYFGVLIAVGIWVVLCFTAFAGGDSIMLATAGARKLERNDMPRLFNVVEEMTIASGLSKMPEVYLIDTDVPNAFAVGKPERSAVAVTTGLLSRLNRDELQGVVAHEIGHIANYDCRFIVLAGVIVGAVVLISDIFLRSLFYGAHGRRRSSSREGGGQAEIIFLIIAIAAAILAPIFAHLLYFACSRRREYLADASSARFTRYPDGLASALEKIAGGASRETKANRVIAPMYIINPLAARGSVGLFSTHPATEERVKILRSMAGGASYAQYEKAYSQITRGAGVMGASALADTSEVAVRGPGAAEAAVSAKTPLGAPVPGTAIPGAPVAGVAALAGGATETEPEPPAAIRRREAKNAIHRLDGYRFAQCRCGTRMKVPPGFKRAAVTCPSCGRSVAVGAAADGGAASGPMRVRLAPAGRGWQSIQCACGATIPISPNFSGRKIGCRKCNRTIEIERP